MNKAFSPSAARLADQRELNWYSHPSLDRLSMRRRDPEFYARRLYGGAVPGDEGTDIERETRFVPVWRGKHLIAPAPPEKRDDPQPVYVDPGVSWWPEFAAGAPILLGEQREERSGRPLIVTYLAIDLSQVPDPAEEPVLKDLGVFVDLRRIGPVLTAGTAALLAYARGMVHWHARHKFCGVCGSPTALREAGFMRACLNPDCGATHHPRTDPAVIMLVTADDRCLLGRSARFPPGMVSTLAGFVEPGESLEDAVAREVWEESRVEVTNIRYHSSQPWPFPSSIMLGFYAEAMTGAITIDPEELEYAHWYERSWLLENATDLSTEPSNQGEFALPRRDSIARRLIDDWLHGRAG